MYYLSWCGFRIETGPCTKSSAVLLPLMRKFEATARLREGTGSCYKDGRQTQPYFLPRRRNRSIGFIFMCHRGLSRGLIRDAWLMQPGVSFSGTLARSILSELTVCLLLAFTARRIDARLKPTIEFAGKVSLAASTNRHGFGKSLMATLAPHCRRGKARNAARLPSAQDPLFWHGGIKRWIPGWDPNVAIFRHTKSPASVRDCRKFPQTSRMSEQKLLKIEN